METPLFILLKPSLFQFCIKSTRIWGFEWQERATEELIEERWQDFLHYISTYN